LTIWTEFQLCKALTSMITSGIESLARPAAIITLTTVAFAARTNRGACTFGWECLGRITKANSCEAHACLVLRGPARRAVFSRCVDRLFTRFAEVKLGKA